jgi:orotidine-5''-phosphate decarboxylase (EC 4.1.1.23)
MKDTTIADKIIVALDVASQEEAIALVDKLPDVSFWKVGLELFVSSGAGDFGNFKTTSKRTARRRNNSWNSG